MLSWGPDSSGRFPVFPWETRQLTKPRSLGVAFSFVFKQLEIAHFPSVVGLSYCGDE